MFLIGIVIGCVIGSIITLLLHCCLILAKETDYDNEQKYNAKND